VAVEDRSRHPGLGGDVLQTGSGEPVAGESPGGRSEDLLPALSPRQPAANDRPVVVGTNFAYYPPAVTEVVAVEPEPHLRRAAEGAARAADVDITVVDGTAERLPASDAFFDAAVASLVLCTVDDQQLALVELHRVLRPGGQLHFFEHVAAGGTALRRLQVLVDHTLWPHLFGGCRTSRDTLNAITAAGFKLKRAEPVNLPFGPASPHVLGVASRPAGPPDRETIS
jgi:SAM-dependent methyltransferase